MSQFSNPASDARQAAKGYTEALLALLGERDPVAVLSATPSRLSELVGGLSEDAFRKPETAGKWSMLQVVQHLADTELVFANRIRLPVAQDHPTITGFDQEAWVDRLWEGRDDVTEALSQFDAVRRINLRYLTRLTEEEWARVGVHVERGPESVRHMARMTAAHDLVHTRQFERIRDAVTGA